MISKKYNRKKIVCLIYNLLFILFFVCLDFLIVKECYNSMLRSAENDDIFGATLAPFFSFFLFAPFFASQLIYIFGSNVFLKGKMVNAPKSSKYLVLTATVIAFLIVLSYLTMAFMEVTQIYFLKVSYNAIFYAWIGLFVLFVLYCVGKYLAYRKSESTKNIK